MSTRIYGSVTREWAPGNEPTLTGLVEAFKDMTGKHGIPEAAKISYCNIDRNGSFDAPQWRTSISWSVELTDPGVADVVREMTWNA
jgi:hypothetical protein